MPFIAIAIAIMVALGGSVAVEHAQPGDSLYQVKASVNSHLGTSTHSFLKSVHIESDTQADADAEASGYASSTLPHERMDDRTDAHASSSVEVHGGTRVKVDLNGDGEDDGVDVSGHGTGSVNTQL